MHFRAQLEIDTCSRSDMKEHLPSLWEDLNMNTNSGFIQSICMQGGIRGHGRALLFALVCFSLSLSLSSSMFDTLLKCTPCQSRPHTLMCQFTTRLSRSPPPFNVHNGALLEYKSCYRKPPKQEWKGCPRQALMITGSFMNTYYLKYIILKRPYPAVYCTFLSWKKVHS